MTRENEREREGGREKNEIRFSLSADKSKLGVGQGLCCGIYSYTATILDAYNLFCLYTRLIHAPGRSVPCK